MVITVDMQPEVRDWIAHNLRQGAPLHAVIGELLKYKVRPELAAAMVEAVTRFVEEGGSQVTAAGGGAEYVPDPLRITAGAQVSAGNRYVRVLMRLQRPAVALLSGLIDEQECEDLISLARPRLAALHRG